MRPFMYSSAARSSKRRMSHIVSNMLPHEVGLRAAAECRGGFVPWPSAHLVAGARAVRLWQAPGGVARARPPPGGARRSSRRASAPRAGAWARCVPTTRNPAPAGQGQPGGVLRQDHPDQLPVAERRRLARPVRPASGPRRRAPAGGPPRRPCTPPPRRTTRGARRGRAPTTRPPRRPSRRPTPAPARPRAASHARRSSAGWGPVANVASPPPRPRRRSPRWRPRRRARRGGSRAAPARSPIVVRRVAPGGSVQPDPRRLAMDGDVPRTTVVRRRQVTQALVRWVWLAVLGVVLVGLFSPLVSIASAEQASSGVRSAQGGLHRRRRGAHLRGPLRPLRALLGQGRRGAPGLRQRRQRASRRPPPGPSTSAPGATPAPSWPGTSTPARSWTTAPCAAGASARTAAWGTATRTTSSRRPPRPPSISGPGARPGRSRRAPRTPARSSTTARCAAGATARPGASDTATRPPSATTRPPAQVAPVNLGPGRTARAIAAGEFHTCAILDNGSLLCWGFDASGQLGYGGTADVGDNETPGPGRPASTSTGTARSPCPAARATPARSWTTAPCAAGASGPTAGSATAATATSTAPPTPPAVEPRGRAHRDRDRLRRRPQLRDPRQRRRALLGLRRQRAPRLRRHQLDRRHRESRATSGPVNLGSGRSARADHRRASPTPARRSTTGPCAAGASGAAAASATATSRTWGTTRRPRARGRSRWAGPCRPWRRTSRWPSPPTTRARRSGPRWASP